MMTFTKVESSNIDGLALVGDQLQVKFKNGGIYGYRGANQQLFDALVGAESVGKAFHTLVKTKPELYPFERLN